ncbi:MAG: DUF87 domain-containing protein [Prevotella sp.]|nr:DUF87 domain-containing protein [Prevotella sp.]
MSNYYIPRKTKIKTIFVKGLTSTDLIWLVFGVGLVALLFVSGLIPLMVLGAVVALLVLFGMLKDSAGDRKYESFIWYFRYLAYPKKYAKALEKGYVEMSRLVPYTGVLDDKFIDYGNYVASVIEIMPVEFGLLGAEAQTMLVNNLGNALRRVGTQNSGSLIAFEKPLLFDNYIDNEIEKYDQLSKNVDRGTFSPEELEAREAVFKSRGQTLEYMNEESKVYRTGYYLVIYSYKKDELDSTTSSVMSALGASLHARRLLGKDLYVFLRANYNKYFNEKDFDHVPFDQRIEWTYPEKIKFGVNKFTMDGEQKTTLTITDYPMDVGSAWLYTFFNYPNCRTVMNFSQVSKGEAEKLIDRAIIEMRSQENKGKESQKMEKQSQLQTIEQMLQQLKTGNEQMFNVKIHITTDVKTASELRHVITEEGFKFSNNSGKQIDAFVSANVSKLDKYDAVERGMVTSTLGACFPFVSDLLMDDKGIMLGSNSNPVFVDFFQRNDVRVNSNMIIIGKSGGGKSFATKSILTNLAADNARIYICDPEKEYSVMAKKLHGGMIDVGNAGHGRFNPFHIYPNMLDEDDDTGEEFDDSFEGHLRFLESFFKIVMEGIRSDALEALNGLVNRLYTMKGIDKYTDFAKLTPEQFPVFDELYDLAKRSYAQAKDEFSRINYRVLTTYLEKFAEGGRYSGLWNGPNSIRTEENFFVFNFLTLLSNKNELVANAQMLLVFKYLEGEVIKNREFNNKYHTKRKIIVVVDEAHVFIDEQRPIALDFMFQMAKRIRKYDGMQIVITQNIKDFVGSPAIAKKSAAIINASQYSLIFSLAPNDMTDLVTLYKNAGGINKREQETIVAAPRGQCFFMYGPVARSTIRIETSNDIRQLFE